MGARKWRSGEAAFHGRSQWDTEWDTARMDYYFGVISSGSVAHSRMERRAIRVDVRARSGRSFCERGCGRRCISPPPTVPTNTVDGLRQPIRAGGLEIGATR